MAKRMDYTIGFNVDTSGLNKIKSALQGLKGVSKDDLVKIDPVNAEQNLQKIKKSVSEVETALKKSFNTDLGTLNISKFNQELKKLDLNKVYKDFSLAGSAGQAAFRNITTQVLTTNMQLKQSHSLLSKMADTMANTIKWGAASAAMNTVTGTARQAYGYIKNLDTSLNDIRIVTGKSADEMTKFASKANDAAKALGQSTRSYTDASLIYFQQGLSDQEVDARAEVTLKAANVTGQSTETVSEQLTAVWNGYKVSAEEAELYIDKLAAVAATTASDLQELSTGMSKVASAANLMGVDIDQLNAQMATIISVTRQAPESVGTALKTIYARMGDIEAGLDTETTLGEYTSKMADMGINVLDANNELRDMGEVINEIGEKWEGMSREQQLSLSQVMAGTRQYNNLLSLFDNWDMYTKSLNESANAAGTLQDQQDIYMESTEAHLSRLKTASEDLYDSLLNTESINGVSDALTSVVELFTNLVDSMGGGIGLLTTFGSIGLRVFSQQIASGLTTTIFNLQAARENQRLYNAELDLTRQLGDLKVEGQNLRDLVSMKREQLILSKSMTEEEERLSNKFIEQKNALYEEKEMLTKMVEEAQETYNLLNKDNQQKTPVIDKDGNVDKQSAETMAEGLDKASANSKEIAKEARAYLSTIKEGSKLHSEQQVLLEKQEQISANLAQKQEEQDEVQQRINELENSAVENARRKQEIENRINEILLERQSLSAEAPGETASEGSAEEVAVETQAPTVNTTQNLDEELRVLNEELVEVAGSIKKVDVEMRNEKNTASNLESEIRELTATERELEEASADTEVRLSDIVAISDEAISKAKNMTTADVKETNAKKELVKLLEKYERVLKIVNNESQSTTVRARAATIANKALADITRVTAEVAEEDARAKEKEAEGLRRATGEADDTRIAMDNLNHSYQKLMSGIKLKSVIQNTIDLVGRMGQLASGIQSFKQLGSIWNNEDLTAGEKTLQIMTNLSMTIPMLMGGIGGLISMVKGLGGAYSFLSETMKLHKLLQTEATAANAKEIAVTTIKNKLYEKEIARRGLNAAAMEEEKRVEIEKIAVEQAEIMVKKQSILLDALKYWWIGLIIGALALLAVAIYNAAKAQQSTKEKMEESNKALEEQQKHLKEVKDEYNNIKTTLENLNNSYKNIVENMVEGTLEWKNAVSELNQQVLELISKYPQLADEVENVNGVLKLSEKGQEELLELTFKEVQRATVGVAVATKKSNEDTVAYKKEQFLKDNTIQTTKNITYAEAQATGKEAGVQKVEQKIASDIMDKTLDLIKAEGTAFLGNLNTISQELYNSNYDELTDTQKSQVDAIQENTDELIALADEIAGFDISNELADSQVVISTLQGMDNQAYNEASGGVQTAVANIFQDDINKVLKDKVDYYTNEKTNAELLAEANIGGYSDLQETDDGYIVLKDIDGNEIKKIYKDNLIGQLAYEAAAREAVTDEALSKAVKEVENIGKNADEKVKDSGQYMTSFVGGVTGSFTGATGAEMQKMEAAFNNDTFFQDNYEAYGFETSDAMKASVEQAVKNYWETYDGAAEAATIQKSADMTNQIQGKIAEDNYESLSDEQKQHLTELENKYKDLGAIQDKNSHQYLKRLREITELEEENAKRELEIEREKLNNDFENQQEKINKLRAEYDKAIAKKDYDEAENIKVELEAETTKFESIMDDIQDNYGQMQIAIEADFKSDIDSAFGLVDEFEKLQELVAEDLTITFDRAQELVQEGYGAMLQNAQATADGAIQIDKNVMNAFIDSRQAELDADKQSKIEQLMNQRAILVAQKEALSAKLTALSSALTAGDEASAKQYLNEARRAEEEYQNKVKELNAELQDESDGAVETEKINEELYNSLGGIYDQNSLNQQNAEVTATDTQKEEIDTRIRNVGKLYNAYQQLGNAVKGAMAGNPPEGPLSVEETEGGGAAKNSEIEEVEGDGDYSVEAISGQELDLSGFFDENGNATEEFKETIQAMSDVTQKELNGVEGQIGAIDVAVAALNGAGKALDNAQAGAGKGDGSGGGGGDDKADQMEAFKDELDIYREINNEIERLNGLLTKQENITSKLHGKARIKSLQKEIDLLEEQNEREKDKLELMYAEQANMQAILKEKAPNVEFDENGVIANYSKILQDKAKEINDAIVAYNSMSKEQQESEKENIENMKKDYEDLKKLMESYDTHIVETIPEQLQKREENLNKRIEKQIEIKDIKVEVQIDKNELRRTIRDFIDEYINDEDDLVSQSKNSLKNFKSVATNNKSDINIYMDRATEDLDAFDKIVDGKRDEGGFENDAAAALESAKTNAESMQKAFADAKAELEEIEANLLEGIDKAKEAFEEQHEKFSQVNDDINHNLKLYQMLNGEDSNYGEQVRFYEAMEQNNLNRVYTAQKEVDFWEKRMKKMTEGSEEWKKAQENCVAAQNQLNSLVEESIENIKNKYHAELNEIIDSTTRELTGGWGLDTLELEWELLNKEADMYLDKVNGAYEIHKLETKTVKALRDNSALAAQERINKLMNDELKKLREKDKLTKYEVERANQLLDLELKKIALAEAQQNKSTMRLRRDAQGNYSYQYTSDQDAIDNAQAEVDEAQNSLYNLDKDEYKNNLDQMLNYYKEFQTKLFEIYTNDSLKQEEKEKQIATLKETYFGIITSLTQDNELIRQNLQSSTFEQLKSLQDGAILGFQGMTDDLMQNIVPAWTSGIQTMIDGFAGKDGEGGFASAWNSAFTKMKNKTNAYEKSLKTLADNSGTNFDALAENAEKLVTPLSTAKSEVKEISKTQKTIVDELIKSKTKADDFANSLKTAAENAREILERLLEASQVKLPEPSSESSNVNVNPTPTYTPTPAPSSASSSSSSSSSNSNNSKSPSSISPSPKNPYIQKQVFGRAVLGSSMIIAYTDGSYKYGNDTSIPALDITELRKEFDKKYSRNIRQFDTGGYTGSWSNGDKDGKLAVLHQKELILNSSDTTKILDAVNIARKLDNLVNLKSIDMSSISALDKIADAFKQVLKEKVKDNKEVKQLVEINANFPNVSSKSEIEEAFEELINLSSQYAFNTNR